MAAQTKTVSGNTTTYVITDMLGSTVSIAATTTPVQGVTCTFSSSGSFHEDGSQMLAQLMLLLATNLLP